MSEEKKNLPVQIKEVIEKSQIKDLTKAQRIALRYVPLMQEVNEFADQLKKLQKGKKEDVPEARKIRRALGKTCSSVAELKKEDKANIIIEQRYIDGLFKTVEGAGRLTQLEAKEHETYFEKLEEAKREKIRIERIAELEKYGDIVGIGDVSEMSEDVWSNFLQGTKTNYENRIAAEKKAEEERLEKERLEKLKNERELKLKIYWPFVPDDHPPFEKLSISEWEDFLAEMENAKEAWDKKQEEIRIENERLKKEADEREKKAKQEAAKRAKEEQERKALELEKEKARQAEEARIKAIADAKIKAEQEAKEQLEKELAAEKERQRKEQEAEKARIQSELNKGDSEKVIDLIKDLGKIKTKYVFKSDKNKKMYSDVHVLIDKVINHIQNK